MQFLRIIGLAIAAIFAGAAMPAVDRRSARDQAVKNMNAVAQDWELEAIRSRPSNEEITSLFANLVETISSTECSRLLTAATAWMDNGGCKLDTAKLEQPLAEVEEEPSPLGDTPVLHHAIQNDERAGFRLESLAFMLTFNCFTFLAGPDLWGAFHTWVQERAGHLFQGVPSRT